MKKLIAAALVVGSVFSTAQASGFSIGVSGSERGIDSFYLSIGDYYHVPYSELVIVERSIPRDEMSVVYFLARHSHRDARHIVGLRLRGLTWWDISIHLGLNPYTLFILDSYRYPYPPYGIAHGYYKPGKMHRLRDREVIDLVNVRFISDYHRIRPDEVIERRRSGERFMNIDSYYRNQRIERERHIERNTERNIYREPSRNFDRNVERNVERNMERNVDRDTSRNVERNVERNQPRGNDRDRSQKGGHGNGNEDRGYNR